VLRVDLNPRGPAPGPATKNATQALKCLSAAKSVALQPYMLTIGAGKRSIGKVLRTKAATGGRRIRLP